MQEISAKRRKCLPLVLGLGFAMAIHCLSFASAAAVEPDSAASERLFAEEVWPLFQAKCMECHSTDEPESSFDMSSLESLMNGGELSSKAAIQTLVPGDPESSMIYQVVLRASEPEMPPAKRNALSDEQVEVIRKWIETGAAWPETLPDVATADALPLDKFAVTVSQGPDGPRWNLTEDDTWALRPPKRYAVPSEGIDQDSVKTAIDAFLFTELNKKDLAVAPAAERLALIRQATYDLTGLPPTPEEVEAFVDDTLGEDEAFDALLERLLASQRYGERWGRHWLDVARYADTDGYANDSERPNAWRYRDYVIRSFNDDKPYDDFIVEQVAGDELAPYDPEMKVAAGFLRMGPWELTGMSVESVVRQLWLDDVTHNTGVSFLALSLRCARCHDHKFDPLPTKDYYRFQANFTTTRFVTPEAKYLPDENVSHIPELLAYIEKKIAYNKKSFDARYEAFRQGRTKYNKSLDPFVEAKDGEEEKIVFIDEENTDIAPDAELKAYAKRRKILLAELPGYEPLAYSVTSAPLEDDDVAPAETFILAGGSLEAKGERVYPGVLSMVYGSDDSEAPSAWNSISPAARGRRLALANWLASPSNSLTARVMVNRIWQWHFGMGIVKTSNNFGKMGSRPTHPELLDWMAQYFVEHRWSVKEMNRLIMRSAAYRRSSSAADVAAVELQDPNNELLSYFPPRRLMSEELRDSVLSIAGVLNLEMGGLPTFPDLNEDLAHQPRKIMGQLASAYRPSPEREQRRRRTVYTHYQRNMAHPIQEVFDGAPMDIACEARRESIVTPQVFNLFNGQFSYDMALEMAANLEAQFPKRKGQIERAFRLTFGRPPSPGEMKTCLAHVRKMSKHHNTVTPEPPKTRERLRRSFIHEFGGKTLVNEDWDWEGFEFNLHPSEVEAHTRGLAELCLVLINSNEFIYIY